MSDDKQPLSKKTVEELMNLLSMGAELNEAQKKQMKDHKFWKTQPVPDYDEQIIQEGPIDKPKTPADIPDTPFPLIKDFEWCDVNLDDDKELDELYSLLYENYVEDEDATFRFKYSHEFFKWALKPPGWRRDWHVGVRVKETGKLVAFIAGTPCTLKLTKSNKIINSVEINFLNIHKKLRSKRLAPVLIKEVTRRINKQDIWQALYTGGQVLPSPVSTCRYTHRPINWSKLYDVGFSHLPPNLTKSKMVAHYALPNETNTPGFRPMTADDLDQVFDLLTKFQQRYELIQDFTKPELNHWLLGGDSIGESGKSNVIKSFVVEDENHKITDFFSYYLLPFTVLNNPDHDELGIAYLYYYASDSVFDEQDSEETGFKKRLNSLMQDVLITSKQFNVDVFNCLTSQDNPYFIKPCKFGNGDGFLNFYLFNYKTFPIHGGMDPNTKEVVHKKGGIGTVLL